MSRKLMLTVDVEAQPRRAAEKHVDRLIWGKFPDGRAGIDEIMDVADGHGARLTMFLDWAETDLHGDAICEAGREIHRRGHDLQLHVHSDFFAREFWTRAGVARELDLNVLSEAQADVIANELAARQIQATGKAPQAFRGGGYRYSASLLNSLRRNGVLLDTSVNISRSTQPVDLALSRQFHWSNGVIEVPVANVAEYRNFPRPIEFNFNSSNFPDPGSMHEFLDNFWRERGDDVVAILVLHSWSLLRLADDGLFRYDGARNLEKFEGFLSGLASDIEFVTATDVVELDGREELAVDPVVDLEQFAQAQQRRAEGSKEPRIPYTARSSVVGRAGYLSLSCPICGASMDRFVRYEGRMCSDCGSLERQRSFAVAYEQGMKQRFDVSGKEVLIFSPSVSELRFLNNQGLKSKRSADIRPEAKPDLVLDICSMHSIESDSQEFVFASYLMPVVYDMQAALDEVERVLAPGGAFVSIEVLRTMGSTREIDDPQVQAAWYGAETLEKYKVGSYRVLGEADYLAELEARFMMERFVGRDPVTGRVSLTLLCWSKKLRGLPRHDFGGTMANATRVKIPAGGKKGRSPAPAEPSSPDELFARAEALWADEQNSESQEQSVKYFHRLYDLGDKARAGYRLGLGYYLGRGVRRDLKTAYGFLAIPELDGTRFALFYRGLILKDLEFDGRDERHALELLQRARDMGVEVAAPHVDELVKRVRPRGEAGDAR